MKVGSFYSGILDIILGISQGSVFGPLLFDIKIIDFFFKEQSTNQVFHVMRMTALRKTEGTHFWKPYQY